jgi:predicted RNase H-like HicB family nuclease
MSRFAEDGSSRRLWTHFESISSQLEKSGSGWWSASVPCLPVIHCTGNTKAETEEIVRMAIELEVEDLKKLGL